MVKKFKGNAQRPILHVGTAGLTLALMLWVATPAFAEPGATEEPPPPVVTEPENPEPEDPPTNEPAPVEVPAVPEPPLPVPDPAPAPEPPAAPEPAAEEPAPVSVPVPAVTRPSPSGARDTENVVPLRSPIAPAPSATAEPSAEPTPTPTPTVAPPTPSEVSPAPIEFSENQESVLEEVDYATVGADPAESPLALVALGVSLMGMLGIGTHYFRSHLSSRLPRFRP